VKLGSLLTEFSREKYNFFMETRKNILGTKIKNKDIKIVFVTSVATKMRLKQVLENYFMTKAIKIKTSLRNNKEYQRPTLKRSFISKNPS